MFRLWRRQASYLVLPRLAARRAPRLKETGTGKGRRRQGPKAGLEPREVTTTAEYQTHSVKKAVGAAGQLDDAAAAETDNAENDSSDSNISSCSQTCGIRNIYTLRMMRDFLEGTKHAKGVRVEDHFPDRVGFVQSVQYLRNNSGGEEGFTDQEIFRLKKIVAKLNHQLTDDSGEMA
ncbi:hypothetical protein MHYP_G00094370 [Metynnis hypsauchen]